MNALCTWFQQTKKNHSLFALKLLLHCVQNYENMITQGRIQDFKLGGAHLKKLRRAEGGAKTFGVFRVKNHDYTPKNHIFSNFRGGRAPGAAPPPPESAPVTIRNYTVMHFVVILYFVNRA
jgi:hypothetical protein